jgi:hypothetical protein
MSIGMGESSIRLCLWNAPPVRPSTLRPMSAISGTSLATFINYKEVTIIKK